MRHCEVQVRAPRRGRLGFETSDSALFAALDVLYVFNLLIESMLQYYILICVFIQWFVLSDASAIKTCKAKKKKAKKKKSHLV